ncbi:hypothetical protein Leryth_017140 [Lithospermum erythrorhizon]|nr:hypothetical protein Leryth_017140 [Lithospermum erythrorhizon]
MSLGSPMACTLCLYLLHYFLYINRPTSNMGLWVAFFLYSDLAGCFPCWIGAELVSIESFETIFAKVKYISWFNDNNPRILVKHFFTPLVRLELGSLDLTQQGCFIKYEIWSRIEDEIGLDQIDYAMRVLNFVVCQELLSM